MATKPKVRVSLDRHLNLSLESDGISMTAPLSPDDALGLITLLAINTRDQIYTLPGAREPIQTRKS